MKQIILKIRENRPDIDPHLIEKALEGDSKALYQLADIACCKGGQYLRPLEWLEVSKWGIKK